MSFSDECFSRIINLTSYKNDKNTDDISNSAKRHNQVKTYDSQLKVYA